ncbi:MAG: Lpg1974 family pore-forming outer membrane protein [Pirellulales bacterium]
MQRAISGWAVAALGIMLAAPANAQVNQLAFRGNTPRVAAHPAYAQISDDEPMVIPVADEASIPREALSPVPQAGATRGTAEAVPAAPQVPAPLTGPMPASGPVGYTFAEPWSTGGGCATCPTGDCGGCGGDCGGGCVINCGPGAHRTSIYGGYLLLRARNAEVPYAVPIDGPITNLPPSNPVQIGSYGIVDPDYQGGYYGGINFAMDQCASIDLRYMGYDSSTDNSISTTAPNVIRSLVAHPSSTSAAQDFLSARADLGIDLDVVDASYRSLWNCGSLCPINWVVGARYAQLDQQFSSLFVNNGTETVNTDVDFEGTGLRLGLEGAKFHSSNQMFVYANGFASFLAGRFRGTYFQGQSFDPEVVSTDWSGGRIVPVLDIEAGVGWQSRSGKLRINTGYMFSGWYNMVNTADFIGAVQANDLTQMSDLLSFDGWNLRAELRF